MRVGSLFSGIGGFDLALERVGVEVAWQVEIDSTCRQILERHWPAVKRYADVRDCEVSNLEPVDLICGGFPCQDLSTAGRRAGLAGERSGLWFEFHRIIAALRPQWVVVENVCGLLSSNGGRDFATVLRGLVECGYGVAWRVLDAQYFGVAQRRRRVFVVGSLGDGRAAQVLFERESLPRDTAPSRETGAAVATTINSGANRSGGTRPPGMNVEEAETLQIAYCLPASSRGTGDGHGNAWNSNYISKTLGSHHGRNDLDSIGAYIAFDYGAAGSEHTFIHRKNGKAQMIARRPDAIAGPMGVRRLMPIECERLQGFPDCWTGGQSDSVRYRQLGNALCVPVAEWIGWRIVARERA